MPIYEYECESCGEREEHIQAMSDPPMRACSHCGKDALRRVISATNFQLKGGGWYRDGYASSRPGAESKTSESKPAGEKKAT